MFSNLLTGTLFLLMLLLTGGSLLTLSSSPHWFVRGWDFPRMQIVVLAWILTATFFVVRQITPGDSVVPSLAFYMLGIFLAGWHGWHILPYTPFYPVQARSTDTKSERKLHDPSSLRFVVSNVEEENDQYELWMQTIEASDAGILIVLEIDEIWVHSTERLIEKYPYRVVRPQNNWYGMMLLSRFPIVSQQLRFLVQDDVPSIDAMIRFDDQTLVRVVAVHPRPPEPIRDNDAVARDAELAIWGKELADERNPVIIGGDLNDVAWSATTRLFLRTSGLLDPRRGRGLFNTFNAKYFFLRFPVDHLFISPHFTVGGIQRLPFVGSDHFPMQIDVRFEPKIQAEQNVLDAHDSDDEEVDNRVERAIDDPKMDGELIEANRGSAIR
jgi:endonuclease/exonuclease/phosphatase (EEP) superfamily protein YafD